MKKRLIYIWITRCMLCCGLLGSSLGLLAQVKMNVEATPGYALAPNPDGNFVLNLSINANTPDALITADHFPEGTFQTSYSTARTGNQYKASLNVPGMGLNTGFIRAYNTDTVVSPFAAELMYTIVTDATLANYPKVTDRLGRISFTPSAADRLNPYPIGGFLQRLMIISSSYIPLLSNIPQGWIPISDQVSVAAATSAGPVTDFQQSGLLEIGYQDVFLSPQEEFNLSLFRWNDNALAWEKLACPQADTLRDKLSVNIARTGTYVLLAMPVKNTAAALVISGERVINVAAHSLQEASVVDTLGILTARGGKEITLIPGFFAVAGSAFQTVLTGSYCVAATGDGSAAREAAAGSKPLAAANPGLAVQRGSADPDSDPTNRVYPNPTRGRVTLTYQVGSMNAGKVRESTISGGPQPVTIRLLDANGILRMLVQNKAVRDPGMHEVTVNISTLPPALYFVELQVGDQPKRVFRVIKQ